MITSTDGAKADPYKHKQPWMRKEEHQLVRITSSLEMLPGRNGVTSVALCDRQTGWLAGHVVSSKGSGTQ